MPLGFFPCDLLLISLSSSSSSFFLFFFYFFLLFFIPFLLSLFLFVLHLFCLLLDFPSFSLVNCSPHLFPLVSPFFSFFSFLPSSLIFSSSFSFSFLLFTFFFSPDPKKPKPLKLADPPAKGILRKTVRNPHRKKSVRFDLPHVATVGTPPEHVGEAGSKAGSSGTGASGTSASSSSNATDEDTRKPKVFLHHEAGPPKQVNKNSQYLGLELFQYYSTLCSRKGIQPWDKLLRQIKVWIYFLDTDSQE